MPVVALLVFDGVPAHHVTAPALVFGSAPRISYRGSPYDLRICSPSGVTTGAPGPFRISVEQGLDGLADAETVIVAGYEGFRDEAPAAVLDAVRAAAGRGSRVGAIGTGVFLLAAAGLLAGRRATTCWHHAAELARRYPRIAVIPEESFVADGPLLTSAGVLGGKELCLHVVEEDHGEQAAVEADRHLFLMLPDPAEVLRADGPPQQTPHDDPVPSAPDREVEAVTRWMEANLQRPLTLAAIAAHAGISVRSLNRRFRASTGLSPLQCLLRARVRRAQWLLERTDLPVGQVAAQTGLGTPANLRHHFQRLNGTTPGTYRAAYRSLAGTFAAAIRPEHADAPVPDEHSERQAAPDA
ncbi:GlxA family transcriptional regulator [Streptomyces zagrosensis]|uniref:Transcriptional regulator GlxA family with amidase domain n=1 Tax=Streptomyces zagrosensis TaxID=1042984 RepID=A0A7W9Q7K4_9ACTN|nr:helix-turn-helix domain-containing protein [Streptomyces zagrosensis]MBB5935035.1 transcriptional regulator GlxA family with amidase domain [Streptomyces zagrosensis]